MLICFFSGLLITGGWSDDGDAPRTAEVWLPGDRSCQLPRLPAPGRFSHTQSSLTACGGQQTRFSCLTFTAGEWEQSHSLSEIRRDHVSWQSPAGTLLMGPRPRQSSEMLSSSDTTTTPGFDLPYPTQ